MPVGDATTRTRREGRRGGRHRRGALPWLATLAVATVLAVTAMLAGAALTAGRPPATALDDEAAAMHPWTTHAAGADADPSPDPPAPTGSTGGETTGSRTTDSGTTGSETTDGAVAAAGPLTVVALGDSVPAAGGCDCTSYASLVGQQLARRRRTQPQVRNLAVGGLTTSGLGAQLQRSDVQDALATADVVLITVGANDFDPDPLTTPACRPASVLPCYQPTLASQRVWLADVLTRVDALTAHQHASVLVTGYWNVFLDGAVGQAQGQAYVDASNSLTVAENAQIAAVTAAHGDRYVDIYTPFKGDGDTDDTSLLAADGDHPNQSGHDAIARAVVDALP